MKLDEPLMSYSVAFSDLSARIRRRIKVTPAVSFMKKEEVPHSVYIFECVWLRVVRVHVSSNHITDTHRHRLHLISSIDKIQVNKPAIKHY